jgi:hypothetical protein
VELELPEAANIRGVRLLEADHAVEPRRDGNRLIVTVPRVAIHEVVAVELGS